MLLSIAIYFTIRKKLFLYYSIYLLILSLYIIDKNSYAYTLPVNTFTKNLNWYLQIIYHFVYFWFSFEFLKYFHHFPNQTRYFKIFTYGLIGTGTFFFILFTVFPNIDFFLNYFLYIHVPITLMGFLFGMWQILKVKEPMKFFYIPGVFFYILFSLVALFLTFGVYAQIQPKPIAYFYIAVLIETSMFTFGLGYLIKKTFQENLNYQKELNIAQEEIKKNLNLKIEQQEIDNEINKLKVSALQNQMNSHFIFNTLNSLKTFIIENDKTLAVNFLNKYAKLMRLYINGSGHSFHSLEEELRGVNLYIEIENQRLNDSINFKLNAGNSINLTKYKIPVHLLIPFLEYSIWKGLLFNQNNKELNINLKEVGNQLTIQICDNGIYNGNKIDKISEKEIANGIEIAKKNIELLNQIEDSQIQLYMQHNESGGMTIIEIFSE